MNPVPDSNADKRVIENFCREWAAYNKFKPSHEEHRRLFDAYFSIFPFEQLVKDAEGFDAGCGSGRWASFVAERVGKLHCIDAASNALDTARRMLSDRKSVEFHLASIGDMPIKDSSQDFGYSLGVLHHIPDTQRAIEDCVAKLKPGAPFLVYLYYRFDISPSWFIALWRITDIARRVTGQ
jgi:ubiquinone/menaquinone biosynthesis C-methylase UbiE